MDQTNQTIDRLLSGYIEHVKIGSRTWTTLAILSVYSISVSTLNPNQNPKLPFIGISLAQEWFSLISIGLMAALITRWLEAQSRAIRTRMDLVEPLIMKADRDCNKSISAKDLWDARVFPGTSAVWSAPASFVRSKLRWVRILSIPYFIFLKYISLTVHFGLPGIAIALLLKNWFAQVQTKSMTAAIIIFGAIAMLQLLVGLFGELSYSKVSISRMIELVKINNKG